MRDRGSTGRIPVIDLEDDDDDAFSITATSVKGSTMKEAISVEQYSEQRDLFLSIIDLDNESDLQMLDATLASGYFSRRKLPFTHSSVTERGGPSGVKGPPFDCAICAETKPSIDSFSVPGCSHSYCEDCIARYVESKLEEKTGEISCPEPNCKGSLEPANCRRILTNAVFDRWGEVLAEALISGSKKLYCPYRDCSAIMMDDGGETVRESECMNCNRLFCAQCNVPWHAGIDCKEFQKLNKNEREREDILLKKLAEGNKWARCPKCGFYVEKVYGCEYVRCRCKTAFCYKCGNVCVKDHYCCICNRGWKLTGLPLLDLYSQHYSQHPYFTHHHFKHLSGRVVEAGFSKMLSSSQQI